MRRLYVISRTIGVDAGVYYCLLAILLLHAYVYLEDMRYIYAFYEESNLLCWKTQSIDVSEREDNKEYPKIVADCFFSNTLI